MRAARLRGRELRPLPVLAAAVLVLGLGLGDGPEALLNPQEQGGGSAGVAQTARQYTINAHVFFWGYWGDVGTATIESALVKQGGRLEKSLRLSGGPTEETAKKKKRDYRGDFRAFKALPLRADGSVDEEAVREWRDVESSASGYLKLNEIVQAERTEFFADHAVNTRQDGTPKRFEGRYGTILSPLEYVRENDLEVGQAVELPFILNGLPRLFYLEVVDLVTLASYESRAYIIDLWAEEMTDAGKTVHKEVWRKKGNVRFWFCKEGPFRNELLRLKIKFRWYLWLYFDLTK